MPLFFLSYARIPGERGPGHDPDKPVFHFFEMLRDRVADLAGVPVEAAGFVERNDGDEDDVARALSRCQVFVPLYSKRYFSDTYCGRQWTAFARRAASGSLPHTVPVLWTPYPVASVPGAVSARPEIVEGGGETEDAYATSGLHQLLDLEEEAALPVVDRLARRIVESATGVSMAPDLDRRTLNTMPDAFAAAPPRPPMRITVLAPSRDRLPIGREPSRYGPKETDWCPYGPVAGGPVAEQVKELARNLGFAPEVVSFDKTLVELEGRNTPVGPWTLVVDPWALQDPEASGRARTFDAAHRPWTAVLTAFADDDPQTKEHSERLRGLVQAAFPRFLRLGRMGEQEAVRGLVTADAFALWFGELAESSYMRYLRYIRPQSTPRNASQGRPPGVGADGLGSGEGGSEVRR
ncbi:FxsC protein [Streptomyces sp. NBC_00306]|uniref:FxsC protein n=1 Tax=Streptomyces sp. NBC_00306 TaxID=2975708 RepID=UPI002E2D9B23|nr:FxsC protein [Streptomyces sp. NBC_00306]